jgi:hypothetical protein
MPFQFLFHLSKTVPLKGMNMISKKLITLFCTFSWKENIIIDYTLEGLIKQSCFDDFKLKQIQTETNFVFSLWQGFSLAIKKKETLKNVSTHL